MSDERKTVIFMHVPKTAGSSLIENFENEYSNHVFFIAKTVQEKLGDDWVNHSKYARENIAKESYTLQKHHKEEVIFGHQTFGWHKIVKGESCYVSFVRSPERRLQSLYKYIIMLNKHYLSDLIKNRSIKDFLEDTKYLDFDNGMVRQFSGVGQEKPFGTIDDSDCQLAIRNIEQHFLFVGIQERFEASLLLMSQLLGWKKRPYIVKVNSSESVSHSLSTSDMAYVLSINNYDIMLYDWLHHRFLQDMERLSERDIDSFSKSNKRFGKLLRVKFRLLRKMKKLING